MTASNNLAVTQPRMTTNKSHESDGLPASPDTGSLGSGVPLIHGSLTEKKQTSLPSSMVDLFKQEVQRKARGVFWFIIAIFLFIFLVVAVVNLDKDFQASLFKGPHSRWHHKYPQPNVVESEQEDSNVKEETPACIHRRIIWKDDFGCSEVIHDFGSEWSTIVDHRSKRCLLFDMHSSLVNDCPSSYPWAMDQQIGAPICNGPAIIVTPVRRIMHHVSCLRDKNISYTGDVIATTCSNYRLFNVDQVIVQFFDKSIHRLVRRSVINASETLSINHVTSSPNPVSNQIASIPVKKSVNPVNIINPNIEKFFRLKSEKMSQLKKLGPLTALLGLQPKPIKQPHTDIFRTFWYELEAKATPNIPVHLDDKGPAESEGNKRMNIVVKKAIKSKFPAKAFYPTVHDSSHKQPKDAPGVGESFWEILYTAVDGQGNLFEGRNFTDLRHRIKRGKIGLLDLNDN